MVIAPVNDDAIAGRIGEGISGEGLSEGGVAQSPNRGVAQAVVISRRLHSSRPAHAMIDRHLRVVQLLHLEVTVALGDLREGIQQAEAFHHGVGPIGAG